MSFVYLSGDYVEERAAHIPIDDRGLLLGDGVFETILVDDGHLESFEMHMRRLKNSASVFRIPLKESPKTIYDAACELVKLNCLSQGYASMRITLTRGSGKRGLLPPEEPQPRLLITVSPYQPLSTPATLKISSYPWEALPPLSQTKSLSYQASVLARIEADEEGFNDALMKSPNGKIICASAANLFLIKDQCFVTPPLSDGAQPGIMRERVMQAAQDKGLNVRTASIIEDDLKTCQTAFLTNSLIRVRPVERIETKQLPLQHPLLEALASDFQWKMAG